MRYVQSGDGSFIDRIKSSSFSGLVHSTFNRTINIQCLQNDELYTIACQEIDNGPNTLIIDTGRLDELNVAVNDRVFINDQRLFIANKLALSIEKANKWESRLPQYPANLEILIRNFSKMKEHINLHGVGGGIKESLKPQNPFEAEMSKILKERVATIQKELLNRDLLNLSTDSIRLIGLGQGLTPSGDDFLVGLFAVLNIPNSPMFPYRTFAEEVIKSAKSLTNDISYMALQKAAQGYVRESIIQLIESIFTGKEEEFTLSLNKVLNIGSSSGTDIALGLYYGLEANIKAGGQV